MDQAFETKYHALEEEHWWFRGRRDCIIRMVEGLGIPRKGKILDLGCSAGSLLSTMTANGFTNLAGIDMSEAAVARCKERGLNNVQRMDAAAPTLPQDNFDLLIASDILEHIEFPTIALENWRQRLRPEGKLLIFVPAYQALWSKHDEANRHFRRYTRPRLMEELRVAEFAIMTSGYWNSLALPGAAAARLTQRFRKNSQESHTDDLKPEKPFVNRTLERMLRFENAILRGGFRAPFGLSTWAIAERPNPKTPNF
jgi:SAM-dependent methyltransferase